MKGDDDLKTVFCPKAKAHPEWHESDEPNIRAEERVIAERYVLGRRRDGTLLIDASSEIDYESGKGEHLYCVDCQHEWRLPKKVDYV